MTMPAAVFAAFSATEVSFVLLMVRFPFDSQQVAPSAEKLHRT